VEVQRGDVEKPGRLVVLHPDPLVGDDFLTGPSPPEGVVELDRPSELGGQALEGPPLVRGAAHPEDGVLGPPDERRQVRPGVE
jgi:hypothetical protein